MDYKKALRRAAGILVLSAGGPFSAHAALPLADGTSGKIATNVGHSDPVFDLLSRTNGSLNGDFVEQTLREIFSNSTPERLRAAPSLLATLSRMGAPANVVAKSRDVLIEIVSRDRSINDDVRQPVLSKLWQMEPDGLKLTAVHKNLRRTPETIEQGRRVAHYSDIRLKHDIALLNRLHNGLGLYRFNYAGSDQAYVGVMAQEVEAIMPEAAARGSDGYLRVYYDMLGIGMQTWEEWVASDQNLPATRH
jgi:hypothetical protein